MRRRKTEELWVYVASWLTKDQAVQFHADIQKAGFSPEIDFKFEPHERDIPGSPWAVLYWAPDVKPSVRKALDMYGKGWMACLRRMEKKHENKA